MYASGPWAIHYKFINTYSSSLTAFGTEKFLTTPEKAVKALPEIKCGFDPARLPKGKYFGSLPICKLRDAFISIYSKCKQRWCGVESAKKLYLCHWMMTDIPSRHSKVPKGTYNDKLEKISYSSNR